MPNHIQLADFVERRSGKDRRGFWARFKRAGKPGQRRQLRRLEDRRKIFLLDHYPQPMRTAAAAILILTLLDGILTLFLVGHGAEELNPIMDSLLRIGPVYFWLGKYTLTVAAVTIVVLFHYYPSRLFAKPAYTFLNLAALIFSAVVAWQVYLVGRFVL